MKLIREDTLAEQNPVLDEPGYQGQSLVQEQAHSYTSIEPAKTGKQLEVEGIDRKVKRDQIQEAAAVRIQATARGQARRKEVYQRSNKLKEFQDENEAAIQIQTAVKSWITCARRKEGESDKIRSDAQSLLSRAEKACVESQKQVTLSRETLSLETAALLRRARVESRKRANRGNDYWHENFTGKVARGSSGNVDKSIGAGNQNRFVAPLRRRLQHGAPLLKILH